MTTNDLLLDQKKTPIAILFDKINIKNNTTLNYLDFDLSAPIPVEIFGSNDNTKTTVVPKLGSAFYKTQDIFYQRLDLADILANPAGEIVPGTATTLFDLLAQINQVFGITLLLEDVYNTGVPAYDINSIPGMTRITVKAKPDSFLFIGSYELLLGPKVKNTTVAPFNIAYFIHTKGYQTPDYLKMVVSINADGSPNTQFSFMRNVTVVDKIVIDRVIQLNNGNLVLNGDFAITTRIASATTSTSIVCKSLTISPTGIVLATNETPLFHSDSTTKYFENLSVPFKYVIDKTTLTGQANGIYRYSQDGTLDATFSAPAIGYVPMLLSVCPDGTVYTVSAVHSAPLAVNNNVLSKQIRIDRINPDGTIDTGFSAVTISGNGNDTPLPVASIVPVAGNGFWMLIQPLYGVSTSSVSPVVNGVPSVPGNVTDVYSWNPIFRISQAGNVNKAFANSFKNFLDKSIFDYPGSNLNVGDTNLIADETSVTFFTHKSNPITGYDFRQPLVLDIQAKIRYLSGSEYEQQWRWVFAREIIAEPDGRFVSFGNLSIKMIDNTYGPVNHCIARYKKSGAIDSLIYRQPNATTLGVPLILANVILYKK